MSMEINRRDVVAGSPPPSIAEGVVGNDVAVLNDCSDSAPYASAWPNRPTASGVAGCAQRARLRTRCAP
jgi:hypothetical protein